MGTWARIGLRAAAVVLFAVAGVAGLLSLFLVVEPGSPLRFLRLVIGLAAGLLGAAAWWLWGRARKPARSRRLRERTVSDADGPA